MTAYNVMRLIAIVQLAVQDLFEFINKEIGGLSEWRVSMNIDDRILDILRAFISSFCAAPDADAGENGEKFGVDAGGVADIVAAGAAVREPKQAWKAIGRALT